jgi:hypothetical protein
MVLQADPKANIFGAYNVGIVSCDPQTGKQTRTDALFRHFEITLICNFDSVVNFFIFWRPRRDLNPCYRRERAVS